MYIGKFFVVVVVVVVVVVSKGDDSVPSPVLTPFHIFAGAVRGCRSHCLDSFGRTGENGRRSHLLQDTRSQHASLISWVGSEARLVIHNGNEPR